MPTFRFANGTEEEAAILADLVQRAYRGDVGWTTEAALLGGKRVDAESVLQRTQDLEARVLVAEKDDAIIGCCEIALRKTGQAAYFGMLAVEPGLQTAGLGRAILAEAEKRAKEVWGVASIEMTVLAQRETLVQWYERRGYEKTGTTQIFPVDVDLGTPLRDDLHFVVLRKKI
ncbi:GCN5-related N-acetyltransferase [Mycena olivaceomarginata]|jgi:ribosomal protein S18 acetylase RimI-like enzyme|nr:GCN5-related N-acetyltransferase [Mycena olivaceomarginata]